MGYFDLKECTKCKSKVSTFDYNWNGGLCGHCKFKRSLLFGILFLIIGLVIVVPLQLVQFNYDLGKCTNLKTTESSYNFTNTIEMNAQFNENCYFLHNHPFALPSYILMALMYSVFIGLFAGMISYMIKPLNFRAIDDD